MQLRWIWLHIILLLAAYAAHLGSVAAGVAAVPDPGAETEVEGCEPRWLPPLDTPLEAIDQIALKTLLFEATCMTAGLLIGSVIAQADYGAKYFSDPKILLTFRIVDRVCRHDLYPAVVGLRGRRAVYLSSFVIMVVLFVWAANQFSAVHRFTTP